MRTLKKSLSLVLVLAMVCSFFVMGTSAAFEDAAEIAPEYVQAIDVLNALEILQGSDGKFNPDGTLTRAAAARIIVAMLKAEEEALVATCTFTDVAEGAWYYDEIAYCQSIGLMLGYGDGTVGPDDELTGPAFALMVMKAIGIDTSSVNPATYALDTVALAKKHNLASVEELTAVPFTREMAAGLACAGLYYTEVGVQYKHVATVGGAITYFDNLSDAILYNVGTGGTITEVPSTTGSLAAKFGVSAATRAVDAFGRPYTYYAKAAWSAPLVYADAPVATYTTAVSESTIYNALGCTELNKSAVVYTDGVPAASADLDKTATTPSIGGAGATVQLYKEYNVATAQYDYTVVVVNNYLAKVDVVTDYVAATATTPKIDASIDLTVYNGVSAGSDLDFDTFLATGFEKDDYVIVTIDRDANNDGTPDTDTVKTVVDATVLSNVAIEKYTKTDVPSFATITVDGTTYPVAGQYEAGIDVYSTVAADTKLEGKYILITDGANVLGTAVYTPALVAPNYAYVSDFEAQAQGSASLISSTNDAKAVAKLCYLDGTTAVVDFKVLTATDATAVAAASSNGVYNDEAIDAGDKYVVVDGLKYNLTESSHATALSGKSAGVFEYTIDADGYLTLSSTASRTVGTNTYGIADATSAKASFTCDAKVAAIGGISGKFANNNTVLTTVAANGTVTSYKGYANFPEVKAADFSGASVIVYTYTNTTITSILVIGDAVAAAPTTGPVAIYLGEGDVTSAGQYYKFYVDGKVETYLATDAGATAIGLLSANDIVGLTLTSGKISAASATGTSAAVTALDEDYFVTSGGAQVYASDVAIYNVSGVAATWAADELVVGDTVTYVTKTVAGDTVVAYIFITTESSNR